MFNSFETNRGTPETWHLVWWCQRGQIPVIQISFSSKIHSNSAHSLPTQLWNFYLNEIKKSYPSKCLHKLRVSTKSSLQNWKFSWDFSHRRLLQISQKRLRNNYSSQNGLSSVRSILEDDNFIFLFTLFGRKNSNKP